MPTTGHIQKLMHSLSFPSFLPNIDFQSVSVEDSAIEQANSGSGFFCCLIDCTASAFPQSHILDSSGLRKMLFQLLEVILFRTTSNPNSLFDWMTVDATLLALTFALSEATTAIPSTKHRHETTEKSCFSTTFAK